MLEPVDLIYVCGNKFLATNSTPSQVQVEYRVTGTRETGSLTLRPGLGGDPGFSETELETSNAGVVELYHNDVRITRRPNQSLPCGSSAMPASASIVAAGTEATVGKWTAPFTWPNIALHLTLLPNGKVLSWGKFIRGTKTPGQPQVWTPSTSAFAGAPILDWIFCSGHTLLSDGKVLVNGGHISDHHGIPDANLFDPATMTWSAKPSMAWGRWYPTTTALANGEAVTIGGRDQNGLPVKVPEVWTGSGWRKLTGAARSLPYYPRTFLAPDGRVFYAGENGGTLFLSTANAGSWTASNTRLYGTRDYGSAVMYQPGKILYVGGGRTTNTAEIVDLNQPNPVWRWTNPMRFRRRHLNATILPTGEVLVTGGTSGIGFNDENAAVFASELWDPATGAWRTLASNSVVRVYHSTALLLPDARVLLTGSGDATDARDFYNAELFSPPYLFKGARPTISSAPTAVGYGQSFFLGTPTPSAITRVTLVRLGSTTHAFDANQRFNELKFVRTTGGLTVTTPGSRNIAPPGHYMVFLLNGTGVPSTARIVRIR
jgi:hypothetical protein